MSNFLIDEDTDLLAAEFVLGTLDSAERANAQSLLRTDHGFIAMVRIWERRFGELHLMVEPVEPDAKITQRIKAKILEISGARAPDGEPQAELTAGPELPKTVASPENAELPQPAEAAAAGMVAGGETPEPQDVPATVTAPAPAEIPATGEAETPVETPPGPAAPAPAEATAAVAVSTFAVLPAAAPPEVVAPPEVAPPAAPEVPAPPELAPPAAEVATAAEIPQPPESPERSDGGPTAKVEVPPSPPPSLKPSDRPSDKLQDQRPARRPEINIDVIRSRSRWRMLGVCMTLLVMGLVALLAAWRFVPDRLPPGLRPAALMLSVGIQTLPKPAPVVKQAPPEPQFDE